MASIDSLAFDQSVYNQGDLITLTIGYTPDTPSVAATTFTATATITDQAGNPLGSSSAPFVVNIPQPAGDKVGVSDDGSRTWAQESDSGTVAVFSATA